MGGVSLEGELLMVSTDHERLVLAELLDEAMRVGDKRLLKNKVRRSLWRMG